MFRNLLLSSMMAIAMIAVPNVTAAKDKDGGSFAKLIMPKGDKTGAIMFEAPLAFGDYLLMLSPLTEDGATKNAETFNIRQKKAVFTSGSTMLQLRAARPGTYVVRMMTTQGWWGGCFSESTVKFKVEPGKISYLGRLDPQLSIASIIAEAQRTGKTTSSGGQLRLMKENVVAPLFFLQGALPADQALALAKKNGFASNAPVVATEIAPASFKRRDKTDITGYCQ